MGTLGVPATARRTESPVPSPQDAAVIATLSERERDVLCLIATGLSNQEIADRLFLGVNTVKTYIRTAYRKIRVQSRSQAVVWAFRSGLVSLDVFDGEPSTGDNDNPEVTATDTDENPTADGGTAYLADDGTDGLVQVW